MENTMTDIYDDLVIDNIKCLTNLPNYNQAIMDFIVETCIEHNSIECMNILMDNFKSRYDFIKTLSHYGSGKPRITNLILSKYRRLSFEQLQNLSYMEFGDFGTFKVMMFHIMRKFKRITFGLETLVEFLMKKRDIRGYFRVINNLVNYALMFKTSDPIIYFIRKHMNEYIELITIIREFGDAIPHIINMYKSARNNIICIYDWFGIKGLEAMKFRQDIIQRVIKDYTPKKLEFLDFINVIGTYKNDPLFDANVFIYEVSSYVYQKNC